MDPVPVTAWFAAAAALALVGLSATVTLRRIKVGVSVGLGSDDLLLRRVRAQGNFVEYVPLALILMGIAETRGAAAGAVAAVGAVMAAGRALHAAGMLAGTVRLRVAGMIATYTALVAGAALAVA